MSFLSLKKNQFFRFLFTGFLNTIFGYSVFSFLIFFSLNYQLAIVIATILGILFNYQSLKRLVFNKSKNNSYETFCEKIMAFLPCYPLWEIGFDEKKNKIFELREFIIIGKEEKLHRIHKF